MDMGRTISVAPEQVEQLLGLAFRRHAVADGNHALEAVLAFGIGDDGAAQVERSLRLVEVGVVAEMVGVPDLDNGADDRLAAFIVHAPAHDQRLTRRSAIVQLRVTFAARCAGNIQRTFDRAGCAARQSRFGLCFIHAQVEEVFESKARGDQAILAALASLRQIVERAPEFVWGHVQVFDRVKKVAHNTIDHLLCARVACACRRVVDLFQQCIDRLFVHLDLLCHQFVGQGEPSVTSPSAGSNGRPACQPLISLGAGERRKPCGAVAPPRPMRLHFRRIRELFEKRSAGSIR